MNILVTGGSGRIGRYVVREFAGAGHIVTNADITPLPTLPGRVIRGGLTQSGGV
jgi:nucleoside-diphosphate-sugar epimerase